MTYLSPHASAYLADDASDDADVDADREDDEGDLYGGEDGDKELADDTGEEEESL